jgi:hypothetical protein
MIYYADWYRMDDGTWEAEFPLFDDYEWLSLMQILRDNPKLWITTDEARC